MPNSSDGQQAIDRFWFMRHGETEFNLRGVRCGGDVDIALTAHGERQIGAMAPQVAAIGVDLIVAGTLLRTQRSAHIISEALGGVAVELDAQFNERSLGAWNGRPYAENEALLRAGATPPGGEAEDQFRLRILRGVALLRPKMTRKILLVSSKGVARILHANLSGGSAGPAANGELIAYAIVSESQVE